MTNLGQGCRLVFVRSLFMDFVIQAGIFSGMPPANGEPVALAVNANAFAM